MKHLYLEELREQLQTRVYADITPNSLVVLERYVPFMSSTQMEELLARKEMDFHLHMDRYFDCQIKPALKQEVAAKATEPVDASIVTPTLIDPVFGDMSKLAGPLSASPVPVAPVETVSKATPPVSRNWIKWSDLQTYDVTEDKDLVFRGKPFEKDGKTYHDAFLRRGDGLTITAGTGEGKSVLVTQLIGCIAAGATFCGLDPVRPLKVAYWQAENHFGDLSQASQGATEQIFKAVAGDNVEAREKVKQLWDENIFVAGEDELRFGDDLFAKVLMDIEKFGIEVFVLDPLSAFFPGALVDEEKLKAWLGRWRAVMHKTGIVLIVIVHNGLRGQAEAKEGKFSAYQTKGDTCIANAFRSMAVLSKIDDEYSRVVWTKRESRVQQVEYYLKRVPGRVAWESVRSLPVELELAVKKPAAKKDFRQKKAEKVEAKVAKIETKSQKDMVEFEEMAREVYHKLPDGPIPSKIVREVVGKVFTCKKSGQFDVISQMVAASWLVRLETGGYTKNPDVGLPL